MKPRRNKNSKPSAPATPASSTALKLQILADPGRGHLDERVRRFRADQRAAAKNGLLILDFKPCSTMKRVRALVHQIARGHLGA
jgi:hypothetical protein